MAIQPFLASIVTLSITLTGGSFARAQISCDLTFVGIENRQEKFIRLSQELAELIYENEHIQRGAQSSLLRATIHTKKLEIVETFADRGDIQKIQAEIDQEVKRHIQKLKESEFKKEAQKSKGEIEIKNENWIKPPLYKLVGAQSLDSKIGPYRLDYLEPIQSFLVKAGKQFKLLDINSSRLGELPVEAKLIEVTDKGRTAIVLDPSDRIVLIDLMTNKILKQATPDLTKYLKRRDGADISNIALSPNKRFVALGSVHGTVLVIDIETSRIVGEANNIVGNFSSWIKTLEFLNNSELLFNGDQIVRIFDFASNQSREVKLNETSSVFAVAVSADKSVVTVAQYKNVVSYSTRNLQETVSQAKVYNDRSHQVGPFSEGGSQTSFMKAIPSDNGHVVMVGNGTENDFGIYSVHNLASRIFDFEESYKARGDHEIKNVSFSPDKQKMFVLVEFEGNRRIDIWQLR